MNVIELHDGMWRQLNDRRAQLPHALLLSGPAGIGKSAFARCFAESLLCEQPLANHQACGACMACGWLAQGNHPDFRVLQPEALSDGESDGAESTGKKKPSQQITIDQVRGLEEFLHVGTHRHGARVILVNPAEAMNRSTANALLKSLEEPIASTLFLLISSNPDRLLPTIRSRCQSIVFPRPSEVCAKAWLAQAGVDETGHWLALAGGSPILAVELATSDEYLLVEALVTALSRGGNGEPLASATTLDRVVKAEKRPAPLRRTIEWSQKWLYDLMLACEGQRPHYFVAQATIIQRLAKAVEKNRLLAFNRKAIQYKLQSDQPLNSRLFLEDFFMSYEMLFRNN